VRRTLLGSWVLALLAPALAPAATPPAFEWKDGDRVVMVGDDLIERDQKYGHLETLITVANPDKTVTFRNLGWSGDTVHGHARAGFGTPADGLKKLKEGVLGLKPTVLIVGYGMAESFDGPAGLPAFVSGMNSLLDDLAPTKARLILLSPIAHANLGPPLPDPARHNASLKLYRDAIKQIAAERNARFVDLFAATDGKLDASTTEDGIHLNDRGYRRLSRVIFEGLGGREPDRAPDRTDALRATINEKNLLYFHRWRPQNETYLFGFRKHEQGNNAREIPLFDPLVEAKEKEIARLRVPARGKEVAQ
jgi:lysophospholipase L1-like esterase